MSRYNKTWVALVAAVLATVKAHAGGFSHDEVELLVGLYLGVLGVFWFGNAEAEA